MFINYFFYAGYIKCYSLFYVELLHRFHANAAQTALFFSMRSGLLSISSLFVMNIMVVQLGERRTLLIGGFLVSLSGILPSFTNDLMAIICLQGICLGLGQSMLCSPGEVLVGAYFKKRRALALPLAKCGASIGGIVMPLLVTYFLQTYGLSGALLLTGGICMHTLATALLFRPTSFFTKHKIQQKEYQVTLDKYATADSDRETTQKLLPPNLQIENKNVTSIQLPFRASSDPDLSSVKKTRGMAERPGSLSNLSDHRWTRGVPALEMEWAVTAGSQELAPKPPLSGGAVFRNSFSSLPDCNGKLEDGFTMIEAGGVCRLVSQDLRSSESLPEKQRCGKCSKASSFMLDCSLFRSPLFRLLLAYFVFFNAPNIMASYLPALASENGVTDSQNGLLLSVMGGLDLVCRLLCALVANAKFMRVPTMIIIAYVILGVASQFVRFLTSFYHFLALSMLLGLLGSVGNAMLPILVLEFVGLNHMGKALGFVILTCGAFSAISFPLLGYIRDVTGSYVPVYHVVGVTSIMAAGLLCLEKCVRRLESKDRQK
ncbi:hypothetical protein ACOMHN_048052 [Nucella lapillus]